MENVKTNVMKLMSFIIKLKKDAKIVLILVKAVNLKIYVLLV